MKGTLHAGLERSQKLAASAQAQTCVAQSWLTRVLSRPLADEDACTAVQFWATFQKSGGDMRALVLDAASSPATLCDRMGN